MTHIAFLISGLHNGAGMERVLTVRLNKLSQYMDVTAITHGQGSRPDFFPLDKRVRRIDLAGDNVEYRHQLTQLLTERRYDITVSTGGTEFFFLHKIKDGSKKIFEFHFSFDIAKVWVSPEVRGFRRWRYIQQQTWHRIYHARKYDQVVVLCKTDYKKWRRYCRHVTYIYNPLTIEARRASLCSSKRAIAVGRLNYQKGFDYLIEAWAKVTSKHPDWKLDIYGEGEEREHLQGMIDNGGHSGVIALKGQTDDIAEKYAESSIFILSSRDEAFGLVITEAEACGLPVVAFNCPSAPAELVEDGVNGFIVGKVGDTADMACKICLLIEDEGLRQSMGRASVEFSRQFSVDRITEKWLELYRSL